MYNIIQIFFRKVLFLFLLIGLTFRAWLPYLCDENQRRKRHNVRDRICSDLTHYIYLSSRSCVPQFRICNYGRHLLYSIWRLMCLYSVFIINNRLFYHILVNNLLSSRSTHSGMFLACGENCDFQVDLHLDAL